MDAYRANREWVRYEGTAQRELFRVLREQFLRRHAVPSGRTLDVGSGPGRFTPSVGGRECRKVAIDLSAAMLGAFRDHWSEPTDPPDLVRADGGAAPFRAGTFAEVAVLGNAIGFAGDSAFDLLDSCAELVGPGGILLIETAPGSPTESTYLHRLPVGAMLRLLHAPTAAVLPRIVREGFRELEAPDRTRHGFRPVGREELGERLGAAGFEILESSAVAPALGGDPVRVEAVRADPLAWKRLLELEERVGGAPAAWRNPAALLTAALRSRPSGARAIK